MKKLLLSLFLLFSTLALFAEDYSRFICPMMAVQPDGSKAMTDVYYAFLEAPMAVLDNGIPQPALDNIFGLKEITETQIDSIETVPESSYEEEVYDEETDTFSTIIVMVPEHTITNTTEVGTGVMGSAVTDVLLEEFVIGYAENLNETKVIIRLAAVSKIGARYRRDVVTAADLAVWDEHLQMFGFTIQKWMTKDEYSELIQTADYTAVEL